MSYEIIENILKVEFIRILTRVQRRKNGDYYFDELYDKDCNLDNGLFNLYNSKSSESIDRGKPC